MIRLWQLAGSGMGMSNLVVCKNLLHSTWFANSISEMQSVLGHMQQRFLPCHVHTKWGKNLLYFFSCQWLDVSTCSNFQGMIFSTYNFVQTRAMLIMIPGTKGSSLECCVTQVWGLAYDLTVAQCRKREGSAVPGSMCNLGSTFHLVLQSLLLSLCVDNIWGTDICVIAFSVNNFYGQWL